MKNVIIVTGGYSGSTDIDSISTGDMAIFSNIDGVYKALRETPTIDDPDNPGTDIPDPDFVQTTINKYNLSLVTERADRTVLSLPINAVDFSYSIEKLVAPGTCKCTTVFKDVVKVGEYSLIVTKLGIPFNERSNYTVTAVMDENDITSTASTNTTNLLNKLIPQIKLIPGITNATSVSGGKLEITSDVNITAVGEGFELDTTAGANTLIKPRGLTQEFIKDLLSRGAADMGYNYTYEDGPSLLYPGYLSDDKGVSYNVNSIVTIKFKNSRITGTTNVEIAQTISILCESGLADVLNDVLSYIEKVSK